MRWASRRGLSTSPAEEKQKAEAGALAKCEEDVLSYALFPQVAAKFLTEKYAPKKPVTENGVRELFVEDACN